MQVPSSCRICLVRAGFVPELGAPIRKATRRSKGSVSFDSHVVDCFSASGIELKRISLKAELLQVKETTVPKAAVVTILSLTIS